MNSSKHIKITGKQVLEQNLIAYHIWGNYKGEEISDYVATNNPESVLKLYPRCKQLYANPCTIGLTKNYKVVS